MKSLVLAQIRFPFGRVLALVAALALLAHPAAAAPRKLADSTSTESWQLASGLKIVTRDIPGAAGISLTLAYGFGSDQDPRNREGWASLLAHVDFLSAAGEFPERTLDQLASSRPLGFRIEVGPRYTRLTEVASAAQFPGVLHQMALRLRSVAPSAKSLAAARKAVQAQLAETYRDRIPFALHYGLRCVARGDSGAMVRYADGKGIQSAAVAEVTAAIRTQYVPANAVLSLAGDLSGAKLDLHRVVDNEFGSIPAGSPAPALADTPLKPGVSSVDRDELDAPVGVVGLIAPALSDTAHPSFLLNALVVGSSFTRRWPRTELTPAPFQYSLLDDPSLLRVYPPVSGSDVRANRIREEYEEALLALTKSTISFSDYQQLRDNMLWLLGGPLSPDLLDRAHTDSGVLAAVSTSSAMRTLWGGEAFWSDYLARFSRIEHPEFSRWAPFFRDPQHQVQLMFVPSYVHKKG